MRFTATAAVLCLSVLTACTAADPTPKITGPDDVPYTFAGDCGVLDDRALDTAFKTPLDVLDVDKAAAVYQGLAEQGNQAGMCFHGLNLMRGLGVEKDVTAGLKMLERTTHPACAVAKFPILGIAYRDGEGVPRDVERAERWFRATAAFLEDPDNAGEIDLEDPQQTPKERAENLRLYASPDVLAARAWWRQTITDTSPEELYQAGLEELNKPDIGDNHYLADRLLYMAATQGHWDAAELHTKNSLSCQFAAYPARDARKLFKDLRKRTKPPSSQIALAFGLSQMHHVQPIIIRNRNGYLWIKLALEIGQLSSDDTRVAEEQLALVSKRLATGDLRVAEHRLKMLRERFGLSPSNP